MSYQKRDNDSVFDLTNSFKGMSLHPEYVPNRDGRLGVPPSYSSPSYNPPVRSNGYYNAAGYTPYGTGQSYGRGGVNRKSRKHRKSKKYRKNNKKSRRYMKK
jgi:hypothetical protein